MPVRTPPARQRTPGEQTATGFLAVDPEVLEPGSAFAFDLYERRGSVHERMLAAGSRWAGEDRDRLALNDVRHLHVAPSQTGAFRSYFASLLDRLVGYTSESLRDRCRITMAAGLQVARDLLLRPEQPALYRQAKKVADAVADLAALEAAAPLFLLQILRREGKVSTHLFNVAAMAVALARRVGITPPDRLGSITLGGFLHDIGKSRLPAEILECRGPLSGEQMARIRSHPDLGLKLAHDADGMTAEAVRMICQHHERQDGTGYPIGFAAKDLPPAVRICAVVDVYDAMTCPRPHRPAFDPEHAVEYLAAQAVSRLDREMTQAWIEIVAKVFRPAVRFASPAEALAAGGDR